MVWSRDDDSDPREKCVCLGIQDVAFTPTLLVQYAVLNGAPHLNEKKLLAIPNFHLILVYFPSTAGPSPSPKLAARRLLCLEPKAMELPEADRMLIIDFNV